MGIFTKYCEICGNRIERGNDIVRFGKHFDSQEHAEQYTKKIEDRRRMAQEASPKRRSCGCC